MGLLDFLRGLFTNTQYIAEVAGDGPVQDAEVIQGSSEQHLVVKLEQPVGDGNEIGQIHVLQNGQTAHADNVYPGETKYSITFNGYKIGVDELEYVFTDKDEKILGSNTVSLIKA